MKGYQELHNLEALKNLTDPRRVTLLQLLMKRERTLTQLGDELDMHPAKVRYHLKLLEGDGLVTLVRTQEHGQYTEKYYRATAGAYLGQISILPQPSPRGSIVAVGSHDLALDRLSRTLTEDDATPDFVTVPVGSINGLMALRQGLGHLAGIHLLDVESHQYNAPYVRHFFPGRKMELMNLVTRQQGFLVAPGNPLGIRGISDLVRPDVRLINRNPGSGTRIWLEGALQEQGIQASHVQGFERTVKTHLEVAAVVAQGDADVGVGVLAAARAYDLHFIPLFSERFDLVFPAQALSEELFRPLFDHINAAAFRQQISPLGGYDLVDTGTVNEVA